MLICLEVSGLTLSSGHMNVKDTNLHPKIINTFDSNIKEKVFNDDKR